MSGETTGTSVPLTTIIQQAAALLTPIVVELVLQELGEGQPGVTTVFNLTSAPAAGLGSAGDLAFVAGSPVAVWANVNGTWSLMGTLGSVSVGSSDDTNFVLLGII